MLLVQYTIIPKVLQKEYWYKNMGPGEDLGLSRGMHKKDESFLSRWRTARSGSKKEDPVCHPLIHYTH